MRKILYVFGLLTDADVAWMAGAGTRRRVPADGTLTVEGTPVDFLGIVLEGELLVSARGAGHLARLGVGEVIGEMSLVEAAPASATIRAARDSLILSIDKAALLDRLGADDGFAARFYRALAVFLADRLRSVTARVGAGPDAPAEALPERDELDAVLLDSISAAGERFHRMLKVLASARPS